VTIFFLLTSGFAMAETDAERLDSLEREVQALKAGKVAGESV
jgi:hypothetical protein